MAGKMWLRNFRKRHSSELTLRKPQDASLARSTAFNRANVALVFQNYKRALENNKGITPFNICKFR